jgi:hypothetical protein
MPGRRSKPPPETVHLWGALHFAVRFDLRGTPHEIFGEAYRIGQAYLLLRGDQFLQEV